MLHTLEIKNKSYVIPERPIQVLVTEFYGEITKQNRTVTVINFNDVVIEHGSATECIDGKIIAAQFEAALNSFKKLPK